LQKSLTYCRHHKVYARTRFNGRWIHLGRYGSEESYAKFKRLAAEFAAAAKVEPLGVDDRITVAEVLAAYVEWAKDYYGDHPGGRYRHSLPVIFSPKRIFNSHW
jgi:hypothetical protein